MKTRNSWLIIVLIIFAYQNSQAQTTFSYSYDSAGNRDNRQVITLKSSENITSIEGKTEQQEIIKEIYVDKAGDINIKIYPNPTEGNLLIQIDKVEKINNGELKVYDIRGTLVVSSNKLKELNYINLLNQPQGTYILKLHVNNEFSTWKIIKQ